MFTRRRRSCWPRRSRATLRLRAAGRRSRSRRVLLCSSRRRIFWRRGIGSRSWRRPCSGSQRTRGRLRSTRPSRLWIFFASTSTTRRRSSRTSRLCTRRACGTGSSTGRWRALCLRSRRSTLQRSERICRRRLR
eukprot:Amastigsp_a511239_8.p4 type:complete len:134 gc:universal Amastigsp_a511239_8:786-385(-)